ncbi:MAG: hypothetical protein K8T25_09305 [Planctomycetia bacterium]|nr:hypothetical protein [Planctomycetia bacterium]
MKRYAARDQESSLVRFLALAAVLLLCGCAKGPPSPQEMAKKADQERAASQTLTDAQCEAFGRQIVEWIKKGDNGAFDGCIDFERIMEKGADGLAVSRRDYEGMTKGAVEGMKHTGLGNQLANQVKQGAEFAFLHVINRNGYKRVVIRQILAGGGITYHELLLVPRDGGIKIVDIYQQATGNLLSETMRQILIPMMKPATGSAEADDVMRSADLMKQMEQQIASQHNREAVATYESMPENFRQLKPSRLLYLNAIVTVDEKKYLKALEEYRRDFPNDAAAEMLGIDGHMMAKHYEQALASCDKVDAAVGGDPYLNVLRGNILVVAARPDEAAIQADKALAGDPSLKKHVDYLRADIALARHDYAALVVALSALESENGLDMNSVKTKTEYAAFRRSPEYRQWIEKRK